MCHNKLGHMPQTRVPTRGGGAMHRGGTFGASDHKVVVVGRHFSTRPGGALSHVGALPQTQFKKYLCPQALKFLKMQHSYIMLIRALKLWVTTPNVSQNVMLVSRINSLDKSDKGFVIFTRKLKVGLQWIYFYYVLRCSTVLHAVSCLGCLLELIIIKW